MQFLGMLGRGGWPGVARGCIGWGNGVMGCGGSRGHDVLVGHAEGPHHELVMLHLQGGSNIRK